MSCWAWDHKPLLLPPPQSLPPNWRAQASTPRSTPSGASFTTPSSGSTPSRPFISPSSMSSVSSALPANCTFSSNPSTWWTCSPFYPISSPSYWTTCPSSTSSARPARSCAWSGSPGSFESLSWSDTSRDCSRYSPRWNKPTRNWDC